MDFKIHHDHGKSQLSAETLAAHLVSDGFVVFVSGRMRQRELAQMVIDLVAPDISAVHLEARSPNDCMCVVDAERFSIFEVLKRAAEIDFQDEADWLRAIGSSSAS